MSISITETFKFFKSKFLAKIDNDLAPNRPGKNNIKL